MRDAWLPYALADLPRYTSYPTAVQFHAGIGEDAAAAWLREAGRGDSLSLYFHIPFCRQLCLYCGCHTYVVNRPARIEGYVDLLMREMDLALAKLDGGPPVTALHFGGGTPTFLTPTQWRRLMAAIRGRFSIAPGAEIAVEIDPRNLGPETVAALAESGVTRASLGVQTLAPQVQAAIGRVQCHGLLEQACRRLRAAGIGRLSFDLMYGLPQQSLADVEATCRAAAALAPQRLAVFGYAHVPWMKKHQRAIDAATLPGARERWAQAEAATATLQALGFQPIGFDHFAHPDDSMALAARSGRLHRNFQGYTVDAAPSLLGFGVSAISALPGGFLQNLKELPRYGDALRAGRLPLVRGVALSDEDRLRGDAIERLLCDQRLDFAALCRDRGFAEDRLDSALPALHHLAEAGLLRFLAPRQIEIPEAARSLCRHAAACFDAYRRPAAGQHSKAV